MSEPRELRHVTRLFPSFLGLRLLPVGGFFLGVGLASMLPGELPSSVQAVLLVVSVAAIWLIHRWYRREYGRVEPERLGLGRNWTILAGLAVAAVAMAIGAQKFGGEGRQVVLLVMVFLVTAVLYGLPRAFGGGGLAMAVVAAIAVLGAAVILAVGRDPLGFSRLGTLFSVIVGIALAVAGWLEHRLLRRTFDRLESGDG